MRSPVGTARPTEEIGHGAGGNSRNRSAAAHSALSSSPVAAMSASWRKRSSLESSHVITRAGMKRMRPPTRTAGRPSSRRRGIWRSEHPRIFAKSFVVQSGATDSWSGIAVVVMPWLLLSKTKAGGSDSHLGACRLPDAKCPSQEAA